MYERWQKEASDPADVEQFTQWMVSRQYVTEYQAALLVHGHADHFFLDAYKLLDRIGKGRMAAVYKAVHQNGQVVAIKILPPSKARDPHFLARFQREARLAWRANHPNVVRVFQAGEADGLHFLVMEYLDGETLEAILKRRGRLPPEEAGQLITQALSGLQHLHERGVVHRNLEPANLMLVPGLQPGQPDNTLNATLKILDVSLGRAVFEHAPPGSANLLRLTHENALLGVSDHLAPEQARNPHGADIRADIYSLGSILYQILAGRPPFPDTNPIRQAIRTATETPRPLRDFNPAVPEGLQLVVNKMMAKDPAQRFATPDLAGQALQVFLASRVQKPAPVPVAAVAHASTPAPPLASPISVPSAPVPPPAAAVVNNFPASRAPLVPAPSSATVPVVPVAIPIAAAPPGDNGWAAASWRPGPAVTQAGFHTTRRDWVVLVLGAGGLLFAEIVGWGLAQLMRPRSREEAPAGPE
jgi:serine/threonine protein kinase